MTEIPLPTNAQIESLIGINGIADNPVTGIVTVIPGTAAEVFAGASAKVGRTLMVMKNTSEYSEAFRIRFGESTITDERGFVLEAQDVVTLHFNPNVATAIYAIAETSPVELEVLEV